MRWLTFPGTTLMILCITGSPPASAQEWGGNGQASPGHFCASCGNGGFGGFGWNGYGPLHFGACDPCLGPCDSPYFPTATSPEPADATTKVHILLVGLTDDPTIGESVAADIKNMRDLLENGIPQEQRYPTKVLQGDEVNQKNILAAVDNMEVGKDEAILCYYSGHGSVDPDHAAGDPSGGRYFSMPQGALYQKSLYDHLRNKRARFVVLLSDSTPSRAPIKGQSAAEGPPKAAKNPVLNSLLFRFRGAVDVDDSTRDLAGWGDENGGLFTQALRDAVNPKLYANPQFVSWKQFLDKLGDATNKRFQKLKNEVKKNKEVRDRLELEGLKSQSEQRPEAADLSVRY